MLIRYLLKTLALPPMLNLVVILFAVLLLRRWPGLRNAVIALSLVSLAIVSMPVTSGFLAGRLEVHPALVIDSMEPADFDAIIVIGGGRWSAAPEYGYLDIPNPATLERLRYTAYLHKGTRLPVMVAAGSVFGDETPESEYMRRVLEQEFQVTVSWEENSSRTTWENAVFAKELLEPENMNRVLLVTHAVHMPRAVFSFTRAGFEVTAAPTIFSTSREGSIDALDFVPNARSLFRSSAALHEMLGLVWYRLRYS